MIDWNNENFEEYSLKAGIFAPLDKLEEILYSYYRLEGGL